MFIKSMRDLGSSEKEKTIGAVERYASPVTKSHARSDVSTTLWRRVPGTPARSVWRNVKGVWRSGSSAVTVEKMTS